VSLLTGLAQYLSDQLPGVAWHPDGTSYPANVTGVYLLGLPATPDRGISLNPYGGLDSTPKLSHDSPNVQALIRGTRDGREALGLAEAVYGVLHGLTETELSEGTYVITCACLQSGPNYLSPDANSRHLFSVNARVTVRNPTLHREPPV
jgi:hypothetical protein